MADYRPALVLGRKHPRRRRLTQCFFFFFFNPAISIGEYTVQQHEGFQMKNKENYQPVRGNTDTSMQAYIHMAAETGTHNARDLARV